MSVNELMLYGARISGTICSPFPIGFQTQLPQAFSYITPGDMEIRQSSLYYDDLSDQVMQPEIKVINMKTKFVVTMF
jgi:hypothetical protein